MARLNGPLHSDAASGSIAKQLTYRRATRGPIVQAYSQPGSVHAHTPTAAQLAVRAKTKQIMETWPTLSTAEKATWDEPANLRGVLPINEFQMVNYRRLADGRALSRTYPPPAPQPAYRMCTVANPPVNQQVTGRYDKIANVNGQPAYKHTGEQTWYLVWVPMVSKWVIDQSPNTAANPPFYSRANPINGTYSPGAPATGYLTISAEYPAVP